MTAIIRSALQCQAPHAALARGVPEALVDAPHAGALAELGLPAQLDLCRLCPQHLLYRRVEHAAEAFSVLALAHLQQRLVPALDRDLLVVQARVDVARALHGLRRRDSELQLLLTGTLAELARQAASNTPGPARARRAPLERRGPVHLRRKQHRAHARSHHDGCHHRHLPSEPHFAHETPSHESENEESTVS
jgi:hypothetical protein